MTNNRKRCSWIHDSLLIHPTGDVYACCHKEPGVFGNIYENTLEEIFNSNTIRQFRQQEIDGTLRCLKGCTLSQKANVKDSVDGNYHAELVHLLVEFGERCNIACVMCTQDHRSVLELDHETLLRNVEIPKACKDVTFFGGEPLILKSAKRFFDHCAAAGTKVRFITNGTAITKELAAKIALHCVSITVSLNGASKEVHEIVNAGSRFEKVVRNVERLVQAKKELNGEVLIGGHMTIVEQNVHEIPEFIRKKDEFGFDFISFGYDWRIPAMLEKDSVLKARLGVEIRAALDQAMDGKEPGYRNRLRTARLQMLGFV